jgi:mannose-1-phosphate guanylyltransferase
MKQQSRKPLKSSKWIYCFGIVPTKPETGYGYIERKGDDVFLLEKTNQVAAIDL